MCTKDTAECCMEKVRCCMQCRCLTAVVGKTSLELLLCTSSGECLMLLESLLKSFLIDCEAITIDNAKNLNNFTLAK